MSIKRTIFLSLVAFTFLIAGCTRDATPGPDPVPGTDPPSATVPAPGETIIAEAMIDLVEVLILESFPVQINTIIQGNLPELVYRVG